MFSVYILLLILPPISAQVIASGRCPTPCVPQNFNINKFLGTWFEITKIPNSVIIGKCVIGKYSLANGGAYINERLDRIIDGEIVSTDVIVRPRNSSEPAKIELQLVKDGPFISKWIVGTDYNTYGIIYTCEQHSHTHSQYAWIIGRTPTLDPNLLNKIIRALIRQGIHAEAMVLTDQSCFTNLPH